MSPPDLSTIGAIQAKAFFWGIGQALQLPTKQEFQRLKLLVLLEKIDPEKVKRIAKAVRERQAIKILVERIENYSSKREAALIMFKRTGALKWYKQWIFYKGEFEKVSQSLAKIYLARRKRIADLEKELRVLFSKCAACGNSSKGRKYCDDCSRKLVEKYMGRASAK